MLSIQFIQWTVTCVFCFQPFNNNNNNNYYYYHYYYYYYYYYFCCYHQINIYSFLIKV